jgi:geranylgeranyl pyrophosphate synthase/predicted secreted hydrolase
VSSDLESSRPATDPAPRFDPELPHGDQAIEWWFFEGAFSPAQGKQRYEFMVGLLRVNLSPENEPAKDGYSLMVTFLDVETGKNYVLSHVDSSTPSGILKRIDLLNEHRIDREVVQVMYKEMEKHGPPRPVELRGGSAVVAPDRLAISWDDLEMEQVDRGFRVTFTAPGLGAHISLFMQPEYPRILWQTEKCAALSDEMVYATYPRMTLTGRMDGQEIEGTAWFDHQWGEYCWYLADDPKKQFIGWDWFGINLPDGTDMLISNIKLMRTGEVVVSRAMVRRPGAEPVTYHGVQVTPLRYWESPRTHIKYPVEYRLHVPEVELDAVFRPLVDDQEVVLLGVARAIWEGAGTIAGTMEGADISGRARGEFFGYGYLFDFQDYVQTLADRVGDRLAEFLPKEFDEAAVAKFVGKPFWRHEPEAYTQLLGVPSWDLISRTGKRWRPIFGTLMLEALGMPSENYEALFCLVELIHSGALIIDDIQDDSLLRRGQPCIHLRYGVDVAISTGTTLYFLPSVPLIDHKYLDDAKKLRLHEIMMQVYMEGQFGQIADIYWSKYLTPEALESWLQEPLEEKILQGYDHKTAAGARGLAEIAAVIAEADDNVKQVCIEFARAFGVAFQIVDDVHNFSDSPKWTKVCGEDIASGKVTYVIVQAIRRLEGAERSRLVSILCSPELRKEQGALLEGIELVRKSGALEHCREVAKRMSLDADERFGDAVPSCEAKVMLRMLCLKMLDLIYDT